MPDEALLQAMECGVKMERIVPKRCDQLMVAAGRAYYERFLRKSAVIHLYAAGLLEAWLKRSWLRRLVDNCAKLLSPLL